MEKALIMKKIKVINGRTEASFVETDAQTLGELIDLLKSKPAYSSVNFDSVKILQKDSQGRVSLTYPEQKISTDSEFKIFLMAEKMKFGEGKNIVINGKEVQTSLIKEMRTKMNKIFDLLLGGAPEEQVAAEVIKQNKVEVTDEDLKDLEEFEG